MNTFDYGSEAELFVASGTFAVKKALRYIPFILASDAIRFAMEELTSARRGGICLEVNEKCQRQSDFASVGRSKTASTVQARRPPIGGLLASRFIPDA